MSIPTVAELNMQNVTDSCNAYINKNNSNKMHSIYQLMK